jgi:hypothetical protein
MLFISTGIFDELCPQMLSVGTTANAGLNVLMKGIGQVPK